eukprot:TRINITY_DN56809_c0_g1_i1.p1 TRINITY_DN56809_c0_g1~~TRINITY_DN56809_c0_g1_i1.p1  ORF type:complete len:113 (+),score=16.52 TRINITY_DN56809_c0_g1_i1:119-457(+)
MIRRPPRSTLSSSSAASDVYKRQQLEQVSLCRVRVYRAVRSLAMRDQMVEPIGVACRQPSIEQHRPHEHLLVPRNQSTRPIQHPDQAQWGPAVVRDMRLSCLLYTSPSPRDS